MSDEEKFEPRNASYWQRQARGFQAEKAEAALKAASEQEPVAIAQCAESGQWLHRTRYGMDTLRDGDKVYAAPTPPAVPEGMLLVPEIRNMNKAKLHGNQSVLVGFVSCRAASAFCAALQPDSSAAKGEE